MKELGWSLYDFFGFAVPGAALLFALTLVFSTFFFPDVPLSAPDFSTQLALILFFLAYVLGHLVQGLTNLIATLIPALKERDILPTTQIEDPVVLKAATRKLAKILDVKAKDIDPKCVPSLCDAYILQNGVTTEREVFQYREGFYRGMALASSLLSIAIAIRAAVPGFSVIWWNVTVKISPIESLFFLVLSLALTVTSYMRLNRFVTHRVSRAIYWFVMKGS